MLGWDAADLAVRAGLARETISNIENDLVQAREGSIERILRAFDENGVQFLGDHGVELKNDELVTIKGGNVYVRLLDEVFHTLHATRNPEALFFFVDNSKSPPVVVAAHKRLREFGVKCRYLCQDKPKRLDFSVADYRCVPDKFFHNNAAVVYADRFATMILDPKTGEDSSAIIIRNPHIAAAQRNIFDLIWSASHPPKKSRHDG